jgi:hypothetical protein
MPIEESIAIAEGTSIVFQYAVVRGRWQSGN